MKSCLSNLPNLFILCLSILLISSSPSISLGQSDDQTSVKKANDEKLFDAISKQDWRAVNQLLLRGADPNAVSEINSLSPLHHAVSELQLETVNLLLKKGAKADAVNNDGETALHFGIYAGESKDQPRLNLIFKALLKAGANPNAMDDDGETVLTEAVTRSETGIAIVQTLIEGGADPNRSNRFGETAAQVLRDLQRDDARLRFLLPLTANPLIKMNQPPSNRDVFEAATLDKLPRLKRMLDAGADVNAVSADPTDSQDTLLHRAASNCNLEFTELLIRRGAKVNARDKYDFTPLYRAVESCGGKNNLRQMVRVLIAAKADVNIQKDDGVTAINQAAQNSEVDLEVIKMLLAAGADPTVADSEDKNAYDYAVEAERKDVIALFQPLIKPFLEKQARALAELRAKLPGKFYTAEDGAEIYYEVRGAKTGVPLFVLHGGPGFDSKYLLASDALDEIGKHRPVIIYDQRGGGYSAKLTASQQPNVKNLVSDLRGLIRHLGYQKIALAGHSWGGYLAMAYAAVFPETIAQLILIDSVTPNYAEFGDYIDFENKYPEEYKVYRQKSAQAAFYRSKKALHESTVAYLKMLFYSAENRDRFIAGARDYTVNAASGALISASADGYNLEPFLRKMKIPTLLIHGEHDANIKSEVSMGILKNLLPQSQVVIFDRSGHLPFYEEPEKFARTVEDFLREKK